MTDIVEILETNSKAAWAIIYEHDSWMKIAAEDIKRHREAAATALYWMESADHLFNCPRIRDDYDCTCGRDEAIQALYGVFEGAQ